MTSRFILGFGLVVLGTALPTTSPATNLFARSLNPQCAPGGNFNLGVWSLQLPIGSTGKPTTISPGGLEGCSGYTNSKYFYTDTSDGTMVMYVPGGPSTGCVTTPNSQHCRTELREMTSSGSAASWDPNASTNRLSVTLLATDVDDGSHGTVIGQIHIDDSVSTKPVCELYYNKSGNLVMGVEETRAGGSSVFTTVGNVAVGTRFSYEIRYEKNVLSVGINGGSQKTLSTNSLDAPASYFKAGNYNQGNIPSTVHFYSVSVQH
jgi:hypothetical protein